jgi:alkylhydroperoxidase family enzyme
MLAVIARAMGCGYGEQEARGFLRDDGVSARDVDEVLSSLDSPRLDARERRLVPFARETVRYQTATIQARFREVCRDFTPAEILETAGTVALANAACRLSVVLDAC